MTINDRAERDSAARKLRQQVMRTTSYEHAQALWERIHDLETVTVYSSDESADDNLFPGTHVAPCGFCGLGV